MIPHSAAGLNLVEQSAAKFRCRARQVFEVAVDQVVSLAAVQFGTDTTAFQPEFADERIRLLRDAWDKVLGSFHGGTDHTRERRRRM